VWLVAQGTRMQFTSFLRRCTTSINIFATKRVSRFGQYH